MSEPLQLYSYWRSSAAYRVRIGLNLKGLPYEIVPVHLVQDGGQQHSEAYRAINPQELVPTLGHGQRRLGQSLAILEYLDEVWPDRPLLPATARARQRVRALSLLVACDVHPLNNLGVQQYLRGEIGATDEAVAQWVRHWIARGFSALEQLVTRHSTDGRHSFGTGVTLADAFLVPQVYNARRAQLDLTPYPRLAAITQHLESLPAFAAARPESQPDAE